jgi:hypothetical protein
MSKGEIIMAYDAYGTFDFIKNAIIGNKLEEMEDVTQPAIEEEEWIWVDGYKGTDSDMTCRGYQYELGKQCDMPEGEEVKDCFSGFHLCLKLEDVFGYYSIGNGHRFFKVRALVRKKDADRYGFHNRYNYNDKLAAKSIIFTEELSVDEVFDAVRDYDVTNFTQEQKERAMATNILKVKEETNIFELENLGYAKEMAAYIVGILGKYDLAMCLGKQTDLSMDTRIEVIFRDNGGSRRSPSIYDIYPNIFATPSSIESSIVEEAISKFGKPASNTLHGGFNHI